MQPFRAPVTMLVCGVLIAALSGCSTEPNGGADGSVGDRDGTSSDAVANRPPQLHPIGNPTVAEQDTLAFRVTATDPDGDTLVFSAEGLPVGATLDPDSGDFSWTPGDGTAGSVPITFEVSDGSLSDSEISVVTVVFTPRTVLTEGGTSGLQSGVPGNGGEITLRNDVGGTIEVLLDGSADPSFTVPEYTAELGAVPLEVTQDTTLDVYESTEAEPLAGTPYLLQDARAIYLSDGDGVIDNNAVTGLRVAAGVTLALQDNETAESRAAVRFTADVVNLGTIVVDPPLGANREDPATGLFMELNLYVGEGDIDLQGLEPGQDGGSVWIVSRFIHSSGNMLTGGADNESGNGGAGGSIWLTATDLLYNEGEINTRGGHSTQPAPPRSSGRGGAAGPIVLSGIGVYNSGALVARGGDGTASAGAGGDVSLHASQGDVRTSGPVDASTGDQTAAQTCCAVSSEGGRISLRARDANARSALVASGQMVSRGGDAANPTQNANAGGSLTLDSDGDITLASNVDLRGGNLVANGSGNPGAGGSLSVKVAHRKDQPVSPRNLRLLGYALFSSRGGAGTPGGNGGVITIDARGAIDVVSEVTLDSRGGDAFEEQTTYAGGLGGAIVFEALDAGSRVAIEGDLLSAGGSSPRVGGFGGPIELVCADVSVDALLDTSGGNADTEVSESIGGNGGDICLPNDATLGASASFDRSGGEGATTGAAGDKGPCSDG